MMALHDAVGCYENGRREMGKIKYNSFRIMSIYVAGMPINSMRLKCDQIGRIHKAMAIEQVGFSFSPRWHRFGHAWVTKQRVEQFISR